MSLEHLARGIALTGLLTTGSACIPKPPVTTSLSAELADSLEPSEPVELPAPGNAFQVSETAFAHLCSPDEGMVTANDVDEQVTRLEDAVNKALVPQSREAMLRLQAQQEIGELRQVVPAGFIEGEPKRELKLTRDETNLNDPRQMQEADLRLTGLRTRMTTWAAAYAGIVDFSTGSPVELQLNAERAMKLQVETAVRSASSSPSVCPEAVISWIVENNTFPRPDQISSEEMPPAPPVAEVKKETGKAPTPAPELQLTPAQLREGFIGSLQEAEAAHAQLVKAEKAVTAFANTYLPN